MQNRYVGDIGDFGKYGLLRALVGLGEASTPSDPICLVSSGTSTEMSRTTRTGNTRATSVAPQQITQGFVHVIPGSTMHSGD